MFRIPMLGVGGIFSSHLGRFSSCRGGKRGRERRKSEEKRKKRDKKDKKEKKGIDGEKKR